jgi:hypothetical protein
MVSKKTSYDAVFYNFNVAMEQNLLKLLEWLTTAVGQSSFSLPDVNADGKNIIY